MVIKWLIFERILFIYCKCNEILYTFAFLVELFDGDGRILHGKGNLCDISLLYLLKWVRSERHNRCQHFQINHMALACIIFPCTTIPHTSHSLCITFPCISMVATHFKSMTWCWFHWWVISVQFLHNLILLSR